MVAPIRLYKNTISSSNKYGVKQCHNSPSSLSNKYGVLREFRNRRNAHRLETGGPYAAASLLRSNYSIAKCYPSVTVANDRAGTCPLL
eukprot:1520794-Pleurochrysis_carterae.AAC.1